MFFLQGASKKLDKFPTSVEEFVEHLSFLGKMSSEMAALEREYAVVIKLYTIAKDFDVPIAPEEHALYQTLSPSFQHLKVNLVMAHSLDPFVELNSLCSLSSCMLKQRKKTTFASSLLPSTASLRESVNKSMSSRTKCGILFFFMAIRWP
jgi:hypothetical protein